MRIARILACAAAVAAAPAVEAIGISLRVGAEQSDDLYQVRTTTGGVVVSEDRRWNDADRFVAEAIYSRSNFLAGIGAEYTGATDHRAATRLEYQVLAVRAEVGATMTVFRHFHLELVPFAAIGSAELLIDPDPSEAVSDRAPYVEYGADGNVVFRIVRLLEIGVGVGWHSSEAEFDNRVSGVPITDRIREERAFGRIFIGAHF